MLAMRLADCRQFKGQIFQTVNKRIHICSRFLATNDTANRLLTDDIITLALLKTGLN